MFREVEKRKYRVSDVGQKVQKVIALPIAAKEYFQNYKQNLAYLASGVVCNVAVISIH